MSRSGAQPRGDAAGARFLRAIRRTEDAGETVAAIALWGIVVVLFLQMFFRYFLRTGLSWPDELARYLHILVVFVALGAVARRGEHIRVTLISSRLRRPRLQRLLVAAELAAAVAIAAGAAEIIGRLGGFRTPALAMPLALFFLPAAIGFALMAVETARRWVEPAAGGRPAAADDPR